MVEVSEKDLSTNNENDSLIEEVRRKKQEAIDLLNQKITEFNEKKFFFSKDKNLIKKLKNFLKNDAKWKFTESYFLQQILIDLSEEFDYEQGLFLDSRNIETIQYFISKVEGIGDTLIDNDSLKFNEYIEILQTVQNALENINPEKKKLDDHKKAIDDINFYLNSLLHGVEVSKEDLEKIYQSIGLVNK